jgi:hypothetical protein
MVMTGFLVGPVLLLENKLANPATQRAGAGLAYIAYCEKMFAKQPLNQKV